MSTETLNIFSERLKQIRNRKGLSGKQLAKIIGEPSPASVTNWESGDNFPRIETFVKIADALEVSTDYLLGRTDVSDLKPRGYYAMKDMPPSLLQEAERHARAKHYPTPDEFIRYAIRRTISSEPLSEEAELAARVAGGEQAPGSQP